MKDRGVEEDEVVVATVELMTLHVRLRSKIEI